ncbi:MAG: hypothetical protein AAF346_01175 [Pseudomonadota bacterium]
MDIFCFFSTLEHVHMRIGLTGNQQVGGDDRTFEDVGVKIQCSDDWNVCPTACRSRSSISASGSGLPVATIAFWLATKTASTLQFASIRRIISSTM